MKAKNISTLKVLVPKEDFEQKKVFSWKEAWVKDMPKLRWLHSSQNGVRMTPGLAQKSIKLGMTKGVSDICLPAKDVNRKYSGLYIELKRLGEVDNTSPEQQEFIRFVRDEGFFSCVCEGHREAIDVIADWVGIEENKRWSRLF